MSNTKTKKRTYTPHTFTPEQIKNRSKAGKVGGKSRSAAKVRASKRNLKTKAWPGIATYKLRRDVESKIARNRREWLLANAEERIGLDVTFVKLNNVLEQLENKSSPNGK